MFDFVLKLCYIINVIRVITINNKQSTKGSKMSVSKISIYKKVLVGNFDDNESAAKKYSSIMTERMTEYCEKEYPNAELDINFELQNASGYSGCFSVRVEYDNDSDSESLIIEDIESEYRFLRAELERSGEIYE